MRRVLVVMGCAVTALLPSAGADASVDLNAQHLTQSVDDCRFSTWYDVTTPLRASGKLTGVVDARCAQSHQIELDLTVTMGESDATAAAGPPNLVTGITEADPVGVVVSSQHNYLDTSTNPTAGALQTTVPAPPAGTVYTVDAIMKFNDACSVFPCNPPPPAAPAAPAMPGDTAPGSGLLTRQGLGACIGEHDGVFDMDCEWQFTVVGRALPAA
jgi:hypothetical protein